MRFVLGFIGQEYDFFKWFRPRCCILCSISRNLDICFVYHFYITNILQKKISNIMSGLVFAEITQINQWQKILWHHH